MKYQYFTLDEFSCPCCGECKISGKFVEKLDELRSLCGFPFKVTSGYRCEKHNSNIGGVPNSAHTKGVAADIWVDSSMKWFKIFQHAPRLFKRMGVNMKDSFIHLDIDEDKPQETAWGY